MSIRWMPSHLGKKPDDPRPNDVSHFDVLANDQADMYAKKGADLCQLPSEVATDYTYHVTLVAKIQKRLATVLLHLPQRKRHKEDKPPPIPRMKLDQLLQDTSHDLVHLDNRVRCLKYYSSCALSDSACKAWLQLPCISAVDRASCSSSHDPAPQPLSQPIHV